MPAAGPWIPERQLPVFEETSEHDGVLEELVVPVRDPESPRMIEERRAEKRGERQVRGVWQEGLQSGLGPGLRASESDHSPSASSRYALRFNGACGRGRAIVPFRYGRSMAAHSH